MGYAAQASLEYPGAIYHLLRPESGARRRRTLLSMDAQSERKDGERSSLQGTVRVVTERHLRLERDAANH